MRTGKIVVILSVLALVYPTACRQSAPINVYDGFESPALSPLWQTDRFVPGSVTIQSQIVRAGHSALRVDLHPHDVFEPGTGGDLDSERDELLEANRLYAREDVPYESSWSMYLPADFPIVPVRLVVAQWKQDCEGAPHCSNDGPVLAIRYVGGVLLITQTFGRKRTILYQETRDLRGHWLDLRFQTRFTPRPTGRIKAWLDGKQVIDFTGVTANAENPTTGYVTPSRFYFKFGLYRDFMPDPMTAYFDEYRKRQLTEAELPISP